MLLSSGRERMNGWMHTINKVKVITDYTVDVLVHACYRFSSADFEFCFFSDLLRNVKSDILRFTMNRKLVLWFTRSMKIFLGMKLKVVGLFC